MFSWKQAFRSILRRRAFSFAVLALLTSGIALNTGAFTILNTVLIRPLSYPKSDQLMTLWEENVKEQKFESVVGPANYTDWKNQSKAFQKIAAYLKWNFNLTGIGEPQRISVALINGPFFETFQVSPLLGKTFVESDKHNENAVVLSYGFWVRNFGSDPNILQKNVVLNGAAYEIYGVMPKQFSFPDPEVQMWVPYGFDSSELILRTGNYLHVIGRLKVGISLAQARSELKTIASQLEKQYPETNKNLSVQIIPMQEYQVGKTRPMLLILFVTVGLILLISCSNAANLLLARAASRRKELAIRAALGAGKRDLVFMMLQEGIILSLTAGVVAFVFVYAWINSFVTLIPLEIPRINEIVVDKTVLAFTLGISLLTAILFSVVPAFFGSDSDLRTALESGGRATEPIKIKKLRGLFVGFQITVATVLLTGSLLFIESLYHLNRVDLGFNLDDRLTFRVWLPRSRYPENEHQSIFFERFLEKLKSIPAVKEAAAIQDLPLRRNRMAYEVQIKGKSTTKNETKELAYRTIAGNYFRLMGIAVIKGRAPANSDSANTMPVVWINKTAAETFWPGENAIGKQLQFAEEERWLTVAGVVNNVKHMGVENEEGAALYQPHAQKTFSYLSWMTVIVQVDGSAEAVVPLIRSQLRELDPNQPLFEITSLEQVFEKATERSRFSTILLSVFAMFAVFLACCGIFSIVQYSVAQRTREIGIRMALGARNHEIISLFFKEGLMLVFGAIVPGVIVSVLLLPLVRSFMYQVQAAEVPTAVVSVFLIFVAVFAATYFPARRASHLDVVTALRCE